VLNFTDALGNISPMVRRCNITTAYLDEEVASNKGNWGSFKSFYYMFKSNVVHNYTDIDSHSWDLYESIGDKNWGSIFFDSSRLIYLFFLQSNATTNPMNGYSNTNDRSSKKNKTQKNSTEKNNKNIKE
jgi:hypothetical protein